MMLALLVFALAMAGTLGSCFNKCNGRGVCNTYGRCDCAKGFQGADCSEAVCPFGEAWSSYPTAIDVAHSREECSNRGICDRSNGICACFEGFSGVACNEQSCGNNCGGVGKCLTVERYGDMHKNDNSVQFQYDPLVNWDANKVRGCLCEEGYWGYDCSLRECKRGDDPLTKYQFNELQLIKCTATSGSFTLFLKGKSSLTIDSTYTAAEMRDAILFIPTITDVNVVYSLGASATACQAQTNVISVEFNQDFGPQLPFVALPDEVILSQSQSVQVSADGTTSFTDANQRSITSVKGTKENEACSGRGLCSNTEGMCTCFSSNGDTYASSNGYGSTGLRGDCGFVSSGTASTCPGEMQCSGHGVCPTDNTFKCNCEVGWEGADCSLRKCPFAKSWFDYPSEDNKAHQEMAMCSNKGICDGAVGMCVCMAGYFGQACEYMSCGGSIEAPCNGRGQCKTLSELAPYTKTNGEYVGLTYGNDPNNHLTWDGHRIHHCVCDEGYSGYDCSLRTCPAGDDPVTWDQVTERMWLQCQADGGAFTLTFREETTAIITPNMTEAQFSAVLNALSTVDEPMVQTVKIDMANGNATSWEPTASICDASYDTFVVIDFIRNHGDLPTLHIASNTLTCSDAAIGVKLEVIHGGDSVEHHDGFVSWDGTTENDVCSNRGLCNVNTGVCECFPGSYSSDGAGGAGSRNDCGYVENVRKRPSLHYNTTIFDAMAANAIADAAVPNLVHPAKDGAFIPSKN